jgi:protein-disulfide isomerase
MHGGRMLALMTLIAAAVLGYFAYRITPTKPVILPAPSAHPSAPASPRAYYYDPVRGTTSAKTTLIEFGDFQCPYCASVEPIVNRFLKTHPEMKLVWKDFPLPDHPLAQDAAEAARCAGDQGKYWEFHDALMASQDNLSADLISATAKNLKLDTNAFTACLGNHANAGRVNAALAEGRAAGVDRIPYFFVNDRTLSGEITVDDLNAALAP